MNTNYEKEDIFSLFINNPNFCNTPQGAKISNCAELKESLSKDLGNGCSSCRKGAIYSKYRQIIYAKIIKSQQ